MLNLTNQGPEDSSRAEESNHRYDTYAGRYVFLMKYVLTVLTLLTYAIFIFNYACLLTYLYTHPKHCDSHDRVTSLRLWALSECEGPVEKVGARVAKRSDI